ncbi:MAG: NADH-quinone oxidoreductase subunit D [Chloroflexi bacterium]|nr:NADH-quinone oxidoreductase subunit D [Chloroflexota bacterium]MCY3581904.1 NADH-quinone oxidoreductase subunit D [Chloroflexota bacterium]MCY3717252.1 NADH-quinone oxidoreductase subunit D [Chloroflexota bacterium]MDE2651446.1 NADH-quinone oxidoreductase subunit D [Chloroflexota bacterium]MXX52024.1 NADH-quinone oxidoreductase subunit D [Chloroflexota bacterium]
MPTAAPAAPLTNTSIEGAIDHLKASYPDAISADDREGYGGIIVDSAQLLDIARVIRDELGFDYLSSATAVDYLGAGDHMEMVYHAYRSSGGGTLVFKAQTDRDNAEIPSLVSVWRGADFQEREAWDLYGIRFPGHPNLKRILMWEGFHGHPMRKDWREAYYEEELKPFDSRWPGGHVHRAEEKNVFGKNVSYPREIDLSRLMDTSETAVYQSLGLGVDVERVMDKDGFETNELVVNMGPHHPSTHGVFRMVLTVDGETVTSLEPVMGYLHRNHEKIGERNTYLHNIPFTDRLDYISSMGNNHGYVLAVEQLLSLGRRYNEPTYRCEALRVMMVELSRIVNHLWAIGFWLNDIGAFFTPVLYFIQERERILDFFEAVAGSRMMCNYMRFGGLFADLPERLKSVSNLTNDRVRDYNTMQFLTEMVSERIPRTIDELEQLLTQNEILIERSVGVGVLSAEDAINYSAAGPLLRGSGVPYDIRRADPYSIYEELDFDVAVEDAGDMYARYRVRVKELRESVRILRQILPRLEATKGQSIWADGKPGAYAPRVPLGEAYGRVENGKGELGYYIVSAGGRSGTANPWRYHVRAPSFINLTPMGIMSKGYKVADIVGILGSIDIVLGETDR